MQIDNKNVLERYRLPREVKFCKKCVISNQRPRIRFDEQGVCSACRYAEIKQNQIDWKKREEELLRVLDRHRSKQGDHDVIVPSSGGKDSSFVAHQLKYKYGMNPLTVTWSPHIYTDIGWKNYQNFIKSGFDNILGNANGRVHRELTRLAFIHLGEPFQPFIYGQKSFPLNISTKYEIPLIIYGEDGEAEYGGDVLHSRQTHNVGEDIARHYFSNMGPEYWVRYGVKRKDLKIYMPPPIEKLRDIGVECHFMGYYKKWIPQENYYYASKHTGFQANPDGRSEGTYSKYASIDDRIDGFHYYLMYIKFGIGRCTSDAAHEIRDGHITREEGVRLVRKYDGEFPKKHFEEFLEYCQLTEDEFWMHIDSWRSPHLWENICGKWEPKHQIV